MTSAKVNLTIGVIILAVGVFYTATIQEGHNWGDDFSMYIHHAKNIVEGIKYGETGYLFEPHFATIGPKTYPPVFPLLLVPVYKYFGLNLTAMKLEVIFFFMLSLLVLYLLFKDELPFHYSIALVTIIGFSPIFWYYKDQVLSEIHFMFFTYLSLLTIKRLHQANNCKYQENINALIIASAIYLSYGTRTIGIILLPSLLVYDLIKFKRPSMLAIKTSFLFLIGMLLQNIFLHSDTEYFFTFKNFSWNIDNILQGIGNLGQVLGFIPTKMNNVIASITSPVIFAVLALYGLYTKAKNNITCTEIFLAIYVIALIPWIIVIQGRGLRYFVPVVPLGMFYILRGFLSFNLRRSTIKEVMFIIFFGAVLISYVYVYAYTNYGSINPGITNAHSRAFFDYIKNNTGPDAVFIFKKPRVLALLTERKASVYPVVCKENLYWDYFKGIKASYLVLGPVDEVYFIPAKRRDRFFVNFLTKNRNCLTQVYANPNFRIYKIKHMPNGHSGEH
jgi:4-amino-4-deoxy-L-arabinose transferase-like glycosyltransferase